MDCAQSGDGMSGARIMATMSSVYDGQSCIGFVFARGAAGFEAFNADEISLGLFPTEAAAANAVADAYAKADHP